VLPPSLAIKSTQAISRMCSKTTFQSEWVNLLLEFPGSQVSSDKDLVYISFNVTLQHLSKALYTSVVISNTTLDPRVRVTYEDCLQLLNDFVDSLARYLSNLSLGVVGSAKEDVLTWLNAARTDLDTCLEGFADDAGPVKDMMNNNLKDLSKLISNCLAIFSIVAHSGDFVSVPIQNRRRLMMATNHFPSWFNRHDRWWLNFPLSAIHADVMVSKDGRGIVKTITDAIKNVSNHNSHRFIIYVKRGS